VHAKPLHGPFPRRM